MKYFTCISFGKEYNNIMINIIIKVFDSCNVIQTYLNCNVLIFEFQNNSLNLTEHSLILKCNNNNYYIIMLYSCNCNYNYFKIIIIIL